MLGTSVIADTQKDEDNLTAYRYVQHLKSPELAALSSFILPPSLGHALAGDWKRGVPFLTADILLLGASFSYVLAQGNKDIFTDTTALSIFATAYALSKIWEVVDAFSTAEDYNNRLTKQYKNILNAPQTFNKSIISDYKNPLTHAISSLFIPSLGQALSGDWLRGLPFLGGSVLGSLLDDKNSKEKYSMGRTIIFISALWGAIDAYQLTESKNNLLITQYNIMLGPYTNHNLDLEMSINIKTK